MKLSNFTAKLTGTKAVVVRALAAATLAGAVLAAAPAAQAQRFVIGVHAGGPAYFSGPPVRAYGPEYYGPRYDDRRYFEERRAHEEWLRHQEWERFHHDRYDHRY